MMGSAINPAGMQHQGLTKVLTRSKARDTHPSDDPVDLN